MTFQVIEIHFILLKFFISLCVITREFFAILRKVFFLEPSERCFLSSQVRVTNSLPKVVENFCEIPRKTPKLLFPFKKVVDIHPTTFV